VSAEPVTSPGRPARARPAPARRRPPAPARPASTTPRLRLVTPSRRAPRAPFVVVLLVLLLVGLLGLLLLNTASAQDAFRLSSLQARQEALALQRQELARQAAALADPARLEAKARALGMVPVGAPTFLAPGQPLPKGATVLAGDLIIVPAPLAPPVQDYPPRSLMRAPAAPSAATPQASAAAKAQAAKAQAANGHATKAPAPKPSSKATAATPSPSKTAGTKAAATMTRPTTPTTTRKAAITPPAPATRTTP